MIRKAAVRKKKKVYRGKQTTKKEGRKKMDHHSPGTVSDFQYFPKSFTSNVARPKRLLAACHFREPMEEGRGRRMAEFFIQITLFPFGYALSGVPVGSNEV